MSKECILSILNRLSEANPSFVIRHSNVVSQERCQDLPSGLTET
ncbi:UDP-glucose 4-epimerase (EC [Olavius algarvensis Delta 1 endosymbiont]|nr:UDP-glucose 4-epimerase (EC [Olavius algarvensis Delta 1 endosymbiont]